jgi:hypothetical protein
MFSDPQTITYLTVAKSLPATSRGVDTSDYVLNDAGTIFTLSLGHQFKTRNRVFARLRRDAYAADPLVPASNILASATCSFTVDFPKIGMTPADIQGLAVALTGFVTSAALLRMIGGET